MPEFFKPEPGLLIWTAISFGVFLLLMWKVALGPLLNILDRRRETIEENLKKAEEAREEAEKLFAEYQRKLDEAKREAQAIIQEGRELGEKLKTEIVEEARREAEAIREKTLRSLELEREKAIQELRDKAAELSVEIASRILKRTISVEENMEIIQDALKEVSKS